MEIKKLALIGFVIAAVLSRFIPHPPNFTPIIAMSLFGGAYFSDKRFAFLIPLAAMFTSDLFLGLHPTLFWVYGSIAVIIVGGMLLKNRIRIPAVIGGALAGSVVFFLITNFGVWITGGGYHHPITLPGLIACYADGIPFFRTALVGNLVYTGILFGGFELLSRKVPALKLETISNN